MTSRHDKLPVESSLLPFGNGRSYGDVCLNEHGVLLATRNLDHFINFDPKIGVLECEAGILLSEITKYTLPHGWFLPVTPGTAFVTVGGAIANDIHGKNHHRAGCFGAHVLSFELRRSNGECFRCSPSEHAELFAATIGGMGLTGLITTVALQLRQIQGPWLIGSSHRFADLQGFFDLSSTADDSNEYTVAWIDCCATGRRLGRGVFMSANHTNGHGSITARSPQRIPITPPLSLINKYSAKIFNEFYYRRTSAEKSVARWHYQEFFYPLDRLLEWNKVYGPKGFFQYQCVIPEQDAARHLKEMLGRVAATGSASFLAVLKKLGSIRSIGLMSFARPGFTLAMDFPNHGTRTLALLDSLDTITREAGGAVYPAKDARMSSESFQQYYPAWREFSGFIDPNFSSSFWRRVTGNIK